MNIATGVIDQLRHRRSCSYLRSEFEGIRTGCKRNGPFDGSENREKQERNKHFCCHKTITLKSNILAGTGSGMTNEGSKVNPESTIVTSGVPSGIRFMVEEDDEKKSPCNITCDSVKRSWLTYNYLYTRIRKRPVQVYFILMSLIFRLDTVGLFGL